MTAGSLAMLKVTEVEVKGGPNLPRCTRAQMTAVKMIHMLHL